ncbi:MAG: efflux RND transporter periplasmic adaptor subunit [Phycisphaerae bacterium]|jgi:multidrug efflux pump subunit AcrA (membrane-fusion protein)
MDTATHPAAAPTAPLAYAADPPRTHSRRRTVLLTAGLALVALILLGAWNANRLFGGWLGSDEGNPTVYTVKEVDLNITLKEDGELKPKNSVDIKCELEGQSTILTVVAESTKVRKGDLLVELASDAIKERLESEEIELRKIESSLEAAQQNLSITQNENASNIKKCEIDLELAELELRRYLEGDFQKSLKAAQINIKQTQMDIERKQDELEKKTELKEKGFVTPTQLEQLEFELEKAEMQLEQNELQMRILLEYEKPKNETQKTAAVDQATQELAREKQRAESRERQAVAKVAEQQALLAVRSNRVQRLREQYDKCKIYAPVDGMVQYPSEEMSWNFGGNRIAPGEKVYEGQTLVVLPDTNQMVVTTRIHEADRHKVHEGLPCLVKVPAVPGRTFTGRIARIAQFADSANRWLNPELKEHTTEVLLDETGAPVSPGDSAEIKILVEEVHGVLAVPVQCVFARGPKNYVFVRRGGSTEFAEVGLGRASTTMVEITSGLSAGDDVLLHADADLLAMLPNPSTIPTETFEQVTENNIEAKAEAAPTTQAVAENQPNEESAPTPAATQPATTQPATSG